MSAARRICVIGNSSVGAVRVALSRRPPLERYDFSFFASAGAKYENVGLAGDLLVGAEADSGGDRDLSTYDAFVMHGRIPATWEAAEFEAFMRPDRYSRAVQALARLDWRDRHKSWGVGLRLAERYGKPTFAIGRNVFANECAGDLGARREGEAILTRTLAPLRFIPLPDALFEDDGRVRRAFFANPVNVRARPVPAHLTDLWHYNREAGGLILDELLRALEETFG
jgi:hypothetical protein